MEAPKEVTHEDIFEDVETGEVEETTDNLPEESAEDNPEVESEVETPEVEESVKDKPKDPWDETNRYLQSQLDQEKKARAELEARLNEVAPKKEETVEPLKPPTESIEDNPIAWIEYQNKLIAESNKTVQSITKEREEERQRQAEAKRQAEFKSGLVGHFMQKGEPYERAVKIFDNLDKVLADPDSLYSYGKFVIDGQPPKTVKKEKLKVPPPPGLGGSGEDEIDTNKTPDDEFNEVTFKKKQERTI